jgi:hypothetical protein
MNRKKLVIPPVEPVKRTMVNQRVLSQATGTSPRTFERWRLRGIGPPFYKVHRSCLYDLEESLAWFKSQPREGGRA